MMTFKVGNTYLELDSSGETKWTWLCVARTKSTVTMENKDRVPPRGGERTVRLAISKVISEAVGAEVCMFGKRYSRGPMLCAASVA